MMDKQLSLQAAEDESAWKSLLSQDTSSAAYSRQTSSVLSGGGTETRRASIIAKVLRC